MVSEASGEFDRGLWLPWGTLQKHERFFESFQRVSRCFNLFQKALKIHEDSCLRLEGFQMVSEGFRGSLKD